MLKPGDTIGILGGGQLARMMALAAAPLGLKCHIFAPKGDNPAFDVAAQRTEALYEDEAALAAFARSVAVVTYEFENVPARTAEILSALVPVLPNPRALETTQDRLIEKRFIRAQGLAVPEFEPVDTLEGLYHAVERIGRPSVLKTRRFGYDGKGQVTIDTAQGLASAYRSLKDVPCVLEQRIPFAFEVSVLVVRALDGQLASCPLRGLLHDERIVQEDQRLRGHIGLVPAPGRQARIGKVDQS